jgi:hypothetical protein
MNGGYASPPEQTRKRLQYIVDLKRRTADAEESLDLCRRPGQQCD